MLKICFPVITRLFMKKTSHIFIFAFTDFTVKQLSKKNEKNMIVRNISLLLPTQTCHLNHPSIKIVFK